MEKSEPVTWSLLLELFLSTLKIGTITFGGGMAMVAVIEQEFCNNKKWIKDTEMLDIIAVSQSLPGVIAINSSIMTGYRVGGVKGAILATFGVTIPSFFVLIIVSLFYTQFRDNAWVNAAFQGLSVGVAALMASVVVRMAKKVLLNAWAIIIFVAAFSVCLFTGVNAIWIILASGIIGFAIKRGGVC